MSKNYIILSIASVLLICCKKPVSDFSADKDSYLAGETIKLKSNISNASSCIWELPDGTLINSKETEYTINPDYNDTTLKIVLRAFTKRGKSDYKEKPISVKSSFFASIYIWPSIYPYYVFVDDVYIGNVSKESISEGPNRNGYKCVTGRFSLGLHNYKVYYGSNSTNYNENSIVQDYVFYSSRKKDTLVVYK